jgi:hypothetical protein
MALTSFWMKTRSMMGIVVLMEKYHECQLLEKEWPRKVEILVPPRDDPSMGSTMVELAVLIDAASDGNH